MPGSPDVIKHKLVRIIKAQQLFPSSSNQSSVLSITLRPNQPLASLLVGIFLNLVLLWEMGQEEAMGSAQDEVGAPLGPLGCEILVLERLPLFPCPLRLGVVSRVAASSCYTTELFTGEHLKDVSFWGDCCLVHF